VIERSKKVNIHIVIYIYTERAYDNTRILDSWQLGRYQETLSKRNKTSGRFVFRKLPAVSRNRHEKSYPLFGGGEQSVITQSMVWR
jgi:hypothetical protein